MVSITAKQKERILKTLDAFENGMRGYGTLVCVADSSMASWKDVRQVSYGRHQATESSGNLRDVLREYTGTTNAKFPNEATAIIARLDANERLCENLDVRTMLKLMGKDDPVMAITQDAYFSKSFYEPALAWFKVNGFSQALSLLVIYDSFIQSGGIRKDIRKKFRESPPKSGGKEKVWVKQYVAAREAWLLSRKSDILRKTIYRTQCMATCVKDDNWDLSKPFSANGHKIQ